MCGLVGFCSLSTRSIDNAAPLLNAMQESIAHRGPDDFGVWVSKDSTVGLANRRLSIVDLSPCGHQPMVDAYDRLVISFNGEIYNFPEIKQELTLLGYVFNSTGDTEVILYAYHAWGIKFLDKLDGMFAIALFDQKNNELLLARDRIGVKPLYFAVQNEMLSFASEIKALWRLPWNKRTISYQAMYHYLTFMITPAPYTLFEKVYKLPAGFYAKVDAQRKITFNEWYSPLKMLATNEQKLVEQEDYCKQKIEDLLLASVKKRMIADVPVGAFLSGGIDSSLNVALMSQYSTQLKTFTVSFEDQPNDDVAMAALVAKEFGTDHHHIEITEKDAYDFYYKMIYYLDEPLADCVCIPFYFVSKLARDNGIKVVQVGEGADELFGGYPVYMKYKRIHDQFLSPLQQIIPGKMRRGMSKTANKFFEKRPDYAEIMSNWANKRPILWGGAVAFGERQKGMVIDINFLRQQVSNNYDPIIEAIYPGLSQAFDSFSIVDYHKKRSDSFFKRDTFLSSLLYFELKQRLPELLLMRADKMSMAASVEAREPFLDYRLVEFMLHVPPALNCRKNQSKYLLKQIAKKYLPEQVITRKKVGFGAPTERWYKHGNYFPDLFTDYASARTGAIFTDRARRLPYEVNVSESLLAVQKWTLQTLWTSL